MPYNKFTSIRLMDDGTLRVSGRSDSARIDDVTAMDVAIIALQDDAKRIDDSAEAIVVGWHSSSKNEPPKQFAPFALDEIVVLIGSETHGAAATTGIPSPFLWHGLFQIVSEHSKSTGEVDVGPLVEEESKA